MTDNTAEIEKDFIAKRDTYFQENYSKKTKSNYLRRYRNDLIRNKIQQLENVNQVLDVGCGPAILYPELLERCESYHAMDLVESNLQKIRTQHNSNKIQTFQSNLDSFKPEEQFYDLVISSGSIEYATDYGNIMKCLLRSLKPNGTLIISFPNKLSLHRIWGEFVYRKVRNILRKGNTTNYKRELFSERFVRKHLGENGPSSNISVEYFGLKLLLQPLDALFPGVDYSILKYFNTHPSKLLSKYSQEFLVVLKK